jgi:hypothetical protein
MNHRCAFDYSYLLVVAVAAIAVVLVLFILPVLTIFRRLLVCISIIVIAIHRRVSTTELRSYCFGVRGLQIRSVSPVALPIGT